MLSKIKIVFVLLIVSFISCDNSIDEQPTFEKLKVDIQMEVQILDSTYQQYKRPFTKIYFTTFQQLRDGTRIQFEESDTTSCQNGWGVKQVSYQLQSQNDIIVLGASCENYNGLNYREIKIDYAEAERRIDSLNHSSIIKTFAIYYK